VTFNSLREIEEDMNGKIFEDRYELLSQTSKRQEIRGQGSPINTKQTTKNNTKASIVHCFGLKKRVMSVPPTGEAFVVFFWGFSASRAFQSAAISAKLLEAEGS